MAKSTAPVEFGRFRELLEAGAFFDAHEVLETAWFPRRGETHPEVEILKWLINGAVALELVKRGRPDAGRRQWAKVAAWKTEPERTGFAEEARRSFTLLERLWRERGPKG